MKKIYLFLIALFFAFTASAAEDDIIVSGAIHDGLGDDVVSIFSAGNAYCYGATTCADINFEMEPVIGETPIDYISIRVWWHFADDNTWVNLKTIAYGQIGDGALTGLETGDKLNFSVQLPAAVIEKINAETQAEGAFAFIHLRTVLTDGTQKGYSNFYLRDDGFIASGGDCDFGIDEETGVPIIQMNNLSINGTATSTSPLKVNSSVLSSISELGNANLLSGFSCESYAYEVIPRATVDGDAIKSLEMLVFYTDGKGNVDPIESTTLLSSDELAYYKEGDKIRFNYSFSSRVAQHVALRSNVSNGKYICARIRARYADNLEEQTSTQNLQYFDIVLQDDFSTNGSECGNVNELSGLYEGIVDNVKLNGMEIGSVGSLSFSGDALSSAYSYGNARLYGGSSCNLYSFSTLPLIEVDGDAVQSLEMLVYYTDGEGNEDPIELTTILGSDELGYYEGNDNINFDYSFSSTVAQQVALKSDVNNGKYICARVRARYAASLENQTPTQNQQFFNIVLYDDFSANESECGTINEETGLAEGIIGNAIIKKESKSQIVNPINSPLDENDVIVGGIAHDGFGDNVISNIIDGNVYIYGLSTCGGISFACKPEVGATPIDYFTVRVFWHLADDANWTRLKFLCSGSSEAGALSGMNSGDYVSFNAQLPASVVTQINAEVQGEMAFPFLQLTTTSTDGNTGGYSNFYPTQEDPFISANGDCDFGDDPTTAVPYVLIDDLMINNVSTAESFELLLKDDGRTLVDADHSGESLFYNGETCKPYSFRVKPAPMVDEEQIKSLTVNVYYTDGNSNDLIESTEILRGGNLSNLVEGDNISFDYSISSKVADHIALRSDLANGKYVYLELRANYLSDPEGHTASQNNQYYKLILQGDFSSNSGNCGMENSDTGIYEGTVENVKVNGEFVEVGLEDDATPYSITLSKDETVLAQGSESTYFELHKATNCTPYHFELVTPKVVDGNAIKSISIISEYVAGSFSEVIDSTIVIDVAEAANLRAGDKISFDYEFSSKLGQYTHLLLDNANNKFIEVSLRVNYKPDLADQSEKQNRYYSKFFIQDDFVSSSSNCGVADPETEVIACPLSNLSVIKGVSVNAKVVTQLKAISIYPNPVSDINGLIIKAPSDAVIEYFTLAGQKVEGNNLETGVYIVVIKSDKQVFTERLVIK